ncbi:hypothetical protein Lser_V15G27348 [Lactuca serriola]
MEFVKHFKKYGKLERGCNSSFITLVPKMKDPLHLGDYRPISLIGCLYNIISKSLANRIKGVIDKNIGEVQTTYVKGRNILDKSLIVNELCAWAKKVKKQVLLFKVDLEKSSDSINWEYLKSILIQMGYGDKRREWSQDSIRNLSRVLRCFQVALGLKVNFNKSRIFGIGVDIPDVTRWVAPLGRQPTSLPFTYLGVPVGSNMKLKKHWKPIIDRFYAKLPLWKSKTLSFGGRAEVMNDIKRVGINFQDILKKHVKNGNDTIFWIDGWCEGSQSPHRLLATIGDFQPSAETYVWKCPISNDGIYDADTLRLKINNIEPTNNEVIIS